MSNIETLMNKKRPHSFTVGECFVVKVAKSIVGRFTIVEKSGIKYAKGTYKGFPFNERVYTCYFLDDETFYGKAIYKVEKRKNIVVFDLETKYPNHREALVGKQFIAGKIGEVYVARRKVSKPASNVWEVKTKASEEIEMVITSAVDGIINVAIIDGSYKKFILNKNTVRDIGFFDDFYIFRLLPNDPPVKDPVFGVVKTVFDKTNERYIVWSPSSRQPSQQIFTSARQARYVAYRMTEQNKDTGAIFYWAKLEGHAQWGNLNNG